MKQLHCLRLINSVCRGDRREAASPGGQLSGSSPSLSREPRRGPKRRLCCVWCVLGVGDRGPSLKAQNIFCSAVALGENVRTPGILRSLGSPQTGDPSPAGWGHSQLPGVRRAGSRGPAAGSCAQKEQAIEVKAESNRAVKLPGAACAEPSGTPGGRLALKP